MTTTIEQQRRIFEFTATDDGIQMFCYLIFFNKNIRYGTNCVHQIQTAKRVTFAEHVTIKQVGLVQSTYRKQRTGVPYIDTALDILEREVRGVMARNELNINQKRADIELFVRHCKEQISEYEKD